MTDTLNLPAALTQWLNELNSTPRPSIAGVLLNHGRLATSVRLAPSRLRGGLGECFNNSMRAAALLVGEGWEYCEGYAFDTRHGIPFEHAWLLGPDGAAWDTTWTNTSDRIYLGITFDMEEVARALQKSERPLLFGDWDRDFELLNSHATCCATVVRTVA